MGMYTTTARFYGVAATCDELPAGLLALGEELYEEPVVYSLDTVDVKAYRGYCEKAGTEYWVLAVDGTYDRDSGAILEPLTPDTGSDWFDAVCWALEALGIGTNSSPQWMRLTVTN